MHDVSDGTNDFNNGTLDITDGIRDILDDTNDKDDDTCKVTDVVDGTIVLTIALIVSRKALNMRVYAVIVLIIAQALMTY